MLKEIEGENRSPSTDKDNEAAASFNPTTWFKTTNKSVSQKGKSSRNSPTNKVDGLSTISEKSDSQLGVSFKFGAANIRTVRTPGNFAGAKLFANTV